MVERGEPTQRIERLPFDLSNNTRFEYKSESIWVYPNAKSDLSENNPAKFKVTPNSSGGGRGIMVWLHESIPLKFREVVLHHELVESDLMLHQGMSRSEAHKNALISHKEYAKQFLSKADYKEFMAWETTVGYTH